MTESDLKRYLIRSIRAQGGIGHRMEDKYAVGWPDCVFIPETGPVFFAEVKLIKTVRKPILACTSQQEHRIYTLERPPHCHGVVIGYSLPREALYIGKPHQSLETARYVPRPSKLDSADWEITHLLIKFDLDARAALGSADRSAAPFPRP